MLRVENIDKWFGGVHALDDVSLEVREGEVHALMGENGAGKSTLGKIVAGVFPPDGGKIFFDGKPAAIHNPMDAQRLGICIIFQELDLFPNLTVAENVAIGNLHLERGRLVNFGELDRLCRPFLDQVELNVSSRTVLMDLPIGQMQQAAIARALSMNARLIVMDEPTSSLTDDAVENLFRLIRKLKESGVSIVFVSHKLEEIFQIADRITVLRDGRMAGTREASETSPEELIRLMVGRDVTDTRREGEGRTDKVLLSVRDLTTEKLREVTFDLHEGEVFGVAGLVGAGRSEIGAALFGLDRVLSGEIHLADAAKGDLREIRPRSPRDAMRLGLGLLPEDRKTQGLMMQMGVRENASMSALSQFQKAGVIMKSSEAEAVEAVNRRTAVRSASPEAEVSSLSGGNQQKVLLSRWLLVDPDVIFLDDPTRGIDVGAKQDVYGIIEELARGGKGVILVSSELPELLRCCDRIMVLHDGRNMGILEARDATQEKIMALATKTVE